MLDFELLKFYPQKTLPGLLNAASDAFEVAGFPFLILKWTPQPGPDATMSGNSIAVWSNFQSRLGQGAKELEAALAASVSEALATEKENTRERQAWKTRQSTTFSLIADAPKGFYLSTYQQNLILDFGERQWSEFICHPLCIERDRVLVLEAKTQDRITANMVASAHKVFLVFDRLYRSLQSQSFTEGLSLQSGENSGALSERETECLQWLAAGKTLGEAALIMGISERTLRFHVANARDRLGVATTIQAVVAASLIYGFHPSDTRQSLYAISRTPFRSLELKAS